jgi:GNAT superfamily N-acetyltransferase
MIARELSRDEVEQVWSIDRREVVENIYSLVDGVLTLRPAYFDIQGWPPGEAGLYTPLLLDCYDRGGWFCGIYDDERLIAVAILESKFIGAEKDQLQLKFFHVSRDYRAHGVGRRLFDLARGEARRRGAKRMYISATPSQNTINFYLRMGCQVVSEPDPELFALEPEDIHLECPV